MNLSVKIVFVFTILIVFGVEEVVFGAHTTESIRGHQSKSRDSFDSDMDSNEDSDDVPVRFIIVGK